MLWAIFTFVSRSESCSLISVVFVGDILVQRAKMIGKRALMEFDIKLKC